MRRRAGTSRAGMCGARDCCRSSRGGGGGVRGGSFRGFNVRRAPRAPLRSGRSRLRTCSARATTATAEALLPTYLCDQRPPFAFGCRSANSLRAWLRSYSGNFRRENDRARNVAELPRAADSEAYRAARDTARGILGRTDMIHEP